MSTNIVLNCTSMLHVQDLTLTVEELSIILGNETYQGIPRIGLNNLWIVDVDFVPHWSLQYQQILLRLMVLVVIFCLQHGLHSWRPASTLSQVSPQIPKSPLWVNIKKLVLRQTISNLPKVISIFYNLVPNC